MRVLLCVGVLVMAAVVAAKKDEEPSMLLGADDVDKKVAESNLVVPTDLKEIKKLAKDDRAQLKSMQTRARALKQQIDNKDTPKSEKKQLKKEFRALKSSLHIKKNEIQTLKNEMAAKKSDKQRNKQHGGRGKGRNNMVLTGAEEAKIDVVDTTTTTKEPSLPLLATQPPRKNGRGGKGGRKGKKNKNKNKPSGDRIMMADAPVLPMPSKEENQVLVRTCITGSDCKTGEKCKANRQGIKVCRARGLKPAGKKCHSSEQCARGLKCFVSHTPEELKHKKHPRRGKGLCADPLTTKTENGAFLPFKSDP